MVGKAWVAALSFAILGWLACDDDRGDGPAPEATSGPTSSIGATGSTAQGCVMYDCLCYCCGFPSVYYSCSGCTNDVPCPGCGGCGGGTGGSMPDGGGGRGGATGGAGAGGSSSGGTGGV
jgi:hypothetical protein